MHLLKRICQYCKMYLYLSPDCAFAIKGHCTFHYITQYCICTNCKMYFSKFPKCICQNLQIYLSGLCNVHLPSRDIAPSIISHNIVFVQIARCISPNFQNVFVKIYKYICRDCAMYICRQGTLHLPLYHTIANH